MRLMLGVDLRSYLGVSDGVVEGEYSPAPSARHTVPLWLLGYTQTSMGSGSIFGNSGIDFGVRVI